MSEFCCRLRPECPISVYLKIVSIAVLLSLVLPFAAHAGPAKAAAPLKPAVPSRLALSVGKTGLPELTVTLVNAGPSPIGFFLNSHNPSLVVEYKAGSG